MGEDLLDSSGYRMKSALGFELSMATHTYVLSAIEDESHELLRQLETPSAHVRRFGSSLRSIPILINPPPQGERSFLLSPSIGRLVRRRIGSAAYRI